MKKRNKHIVLIRGLGKESAHWGDVTPGLSKLLPDFQVMALDMRGSGRYYQEKTPLKMSEIVLRMRADFLEKLPSQQEHECYLVAISLGGMIASFWLNHYPQDFKKAVLINTSFSGISPFYQRLRLSCLPRLIRVALNRSLHRREKLTLELISNDPKKQQEALPRWVEIQKKRPVRTMNLIRQLLVACFYTPSITWTIPTLLLASKKDRMVNSRCSEDIHQKHHFPIIYHSEAGHALTVDDARWLVDQISFWINNEIPQ